jgi:hypothetical protein
MLFIFSSCSKEEPSYDYKPLGTSAKDLLGSSGYNSLKIEIQYMEGYAPDAGSIDKFLFFLESRLNKPMGVEVVQQPIAASNKTGFTIPEIAKLEKQYRSIFTRQNELTIHIFITDNKCSSSDILATAYWNTSFCIFGKALAENSGGPGQVSQPVLLATLLEHEFCHLLGLVNQGTLMQTAHTDPASGDHCNNPSCLMYYDVESTNAGSGNITSVPVLDANCLADLKANGGK